MKRLVTLLLGVLLLAPGIVTAAEKKAAQEPPGAAAAKTLPQKLDINRASLEELVDIPGIGPRMGQEIVDLRAKKGSFTRIEELLEVTGIKEKKLAALAGYLEVKPLQTSTAASSASESR